ncbi:type II toxin-antitoxin system Phd/YefM family antitoxin [Paracoccus bogoriensis]|uniref:type II toxin-antitoxin system Phd/YefM family antitoxin n=1 Tax=Paracoccus bogoriensis TaxID=242065 RepID=UPI001C679CC3|nr:type II toxin-antitoxin system Phd/YefM family antitoxin [Paracoccus bogoriensis]MBW7057804.1 type II toxin-antitoxin system Phd/YefM family antitoxin [Paracoccus bogoriensis]
MWNLQDAKTRFSALVADALAGRPQHVTRRGKPAVVVLSEADYAQLLAAARGARESFVDHLLAFPRDDKALPRAKVAPRDVSF